MYVCMYHVFIVPPTLFHRTTTPFHYYFSTVPLLCFINNVPLNHHTVPSSLLYCFTTFFYHHCSTVQPFHHHCSTVALSLFYCFITLFHHYCFTVPLFHHQCFTFPPRMLTSADLYAPSVFHHCSSSVQVFDVFKQCGRISVRWVLLKYSFALWRNDFVTKSSFCLVFLKVPCCWIMSCV